MSAHKYLVWLKEDGIFKFHSLTLAPKYILQKYQNLTDEISTVSCVT